MKKFFKWIGIALVAVIALVIIVSVSTSGDSGSSSSSNDTKAKADSSKSSDKKKADVNKNLSVGDTAKANGFKVTVQSAKFTDPAQYTKSKNGKVLTIQLHVENGSESQSFIDESDFNLYSKDGTKLDPYFGYDEMALSAPNLNKGKKVDGKLYYDVPANKEYELDYTPAFSWSGKEIKWTIKPGN